MLQRFAFAWGIVLGLAATGRAADAGADHEAFFERHIRPLLASRCVECHGGRSEIRGGLQLTTRQHVLSGGDSGPVVVPGRPDKSLLMAAVGHVGPKMPPDGRLTDEQIAHLRTWITLGLPWPDASPIVSPVSTNSREATFQISDEQASHWAFQPVRMPPLPKVQHATWPRGPIDRFLLAAMEREQLVPSEAASKRAWLRRATFDLTGLPPSPSEVDTFASDGSFDSYDRVIDRLLASPAYGERWGRFWLDVARYADNKGYSFEEESNMIWAYTYRDYVVRAFNSDLSYDRFILEQLAADQLPMHGDRRALAALGFVTCGGNFLKNVPDMVDDRIDVVTRGFLGLTVSCARCHDHKFDPVPSADYYSLFGVLGNCVEPLVPPVIADPPRNDQYAAFEAELNKRETALGQFLQDKRANVVRNARRRVGEYLLASYQQRGKPKIEDFMLVADADDLNPTMLSYYQAYLEETARHHHPIFAPWHALTALSEHEFAQRSGDRITAWRSPADPSQLVFKAAQRENFGHERNDPQDRASHGQPERMTMPGAINPWVLRALADHPLRTVAELAEVYGRLLVSIDDEWQQLVAAAQQSQQPAPAGLPDADREALRLVLYGSDAPANGQLNLYGYEILPDRPSQDARKKLYQAVMEWRTKEPSAPPRAMALVDLHPVKEPYIFLRGNPNQRGPVVPRQFLRVLSPSEREPFRKGAGRLELAQAIASPQNPLTARVLVNRVWQHHFGSPLVRTPSDFGLRSAPPSHPELLDYLAATFMRDGWSIKNLHRAILLSAAYQQSSDDREEMRKIDPENRLLWRFHRQRLGFEAMRDALLAAASRLDRTIGGPSVRDISAITTARRTIYGYVDREYLAGLYRTFDFPSPDTSSPQRDPTTVPQQALFWMNHPLVAEAAKALIQRPEVADARGTETRVMRLYELLFGREPTRGELALAQEFLGDDATPMAWGQYAHSLLLTNEFVFID